MTPEMKQRLLEFADAEIQRKAEGKNYLGGHNVIVEDNLISLPFLGGEPQEINEETWRLALIGRWTLVTNFLPPPYQSDWLVFGTIPRSTGNFFINVGFPRTASTSTTTGNFFYYDFEFYTRIYEPSQESIPAPGPASETFGTPYPGIIRFTMEQRGPGFPGTVYALDTVTVYPDGTGGTYSGAPAVPNVTLTVSPVLTSFERVR
jgi:hypothetical protein